MDYEVVASASENNFFKNTGFEYVFDISMETLKPMMHYFSVDKKWPLRNKKMAIKLEFGLIWEANLKYTGSLKRENRNNFQIFIRPNVIF